MLVGLACIVTVLLLVASEDSNVGGAPERTLISLNDGTYRGVGIDDPRADVTRLFGARPPYDESTDPGFPTAAKQVSPARGFNCKSPPPRSPREVLAYEQVSFYLDNGTVCGLIVTRDGASTENGVAVGDQLDDARQAFSRIECGSASRGGEPLLGDDDFPYCTVDLGKRRHVWFGNDPIDTIQLNSERLPR